MSNDFSRTFDDADLEFQRLVERAMRSCGWLLPQTPGEVRRAEEDPEIIATELPESLKDPRRILERALRETAETTDSPHPDAADKKAIPTALAQLATEVGLSTEQSLTLFNMQSQIFAHRSSTRNQEPTLADWRRFYKDLKEFL
jgi:hypothetical protein